MTRSSSPKRASADAGLNQAEARHGGGAVPRLRFDKVALRLVRGVRGALEGAVPEGLSVVFAVTAPIREPAKTMAALAETIRVRLSNGAAPGERAETIHGNRIRVRLVTNRSRHPARIAGFVHNPEPSPGALLDMAQLLLNGVGAPASSDRPAGEVASLQRICEQLFNMGD
jgi:hypothetical protein